MRKLLKASFAHRHLLCAHRFLAMIATLAIVISLLPQVAFAKNTYIITDGDNVMVHTSYSTDPVEVIDEAGLKLGEEDTYTTQENDGVSEIIISRIQTITILHDGQTTMIGSYGETVGELLARLNIEVADNDRLTYPENSFTFDGMCLEVISVTTQTVTYEEAIAYETVYYENTSLGNGEEEVVVTGVDGAARYTAEITYEDGEEVSRKIIQEEIISAPVDEVIMCSNNRATRTQEGAGRVYTPAVETPAPTEAAPAAQTPTPAAESSADSTTSSAQSGNASSDTDSSNSTADTSTQSSGNTITTASGDVLSYSSVLTCSATAYTCEGYTGYTASGTVAKYGSVAVDPSVIPLGTRLYIVTADGSFIYGVGTAEDTGGAIKGNTIDLYFNTLSECYSFGRQTCTVYILN